MGKPLSDFRPVTLRLPATLYQTLCRSAEAHGRSLDGEILFRLAGRLEAPDRSVTDSDTALAAVGVVLGIG